MGPGSARPPACHAGGLPALTPESSPPATGIFHGIVVQLPLPIRCVLRPLGGKKGVSPPYYIRVKLRFGSFEPLIAVSLFVRSRDPDELHPDPLVVLAQGGLQLVEELLHPIFVRVIDEVIKNALVHLF